MGERVNIHPTAVIHPEAKIHPSVTVGPYAVIEGPAVIAEGCVISAHAIITGEVQMGPRNTIGHGALIGGDPQDLAFKPEVKSRVVIGEGNRIREYVTIHRGTAEGSETVVGSHCYLMAGAHLAHNVRLEDYVILANNALLGGYVTIGERVFVGGGAVFHQFIRVGAYAICQGISGFGKDLPPYVIGADVNGVAGLNVVGLRRAGFNPEQRAEVKRAFDILYRRGHNTKQALAAAELETWTDVGRRFWDFVGSAKKKGLCDWLGSRKGGTTGGEE
jgi:UDP-N-acetylglucosamine acyltransferase